MAEVRLRLLRRTAQLPVVEDIFPAVRAVLASSCMASMVYNRQYSECNHRKRTLWASSVPSGKCMWVPQLATAGARLYSQGSGSRSSFHQCGSRRRHNNGAMESEVPLYMTRTGYYDILELSSKATQTQIKTAYYKQSFRFHPDRNAGNETASRRFGQVTEAYHILGSINLRKKYDRGILSLEDVRTSTKPSGKTSSPSRKEAAGQRPSTNTSTTLSKPMFNFDAFYQAHYGEQLAREKQWRERREHMEKNKQEQKTGSHLNKMTDLPILLLIIPVFIFYLSFRVEETPPKSP